MKSFFRVFLLILLSNTIFAQAPKVLNLQRFDTKKIHFVIQLGVNSAGFALHRKTPLPEDSLRAIDVVPQSGFHIGMITDLHLHPHFHLRFVPAYVFSQRNIDFTFVNTAGKINVVTRAIESNYIEFPLLFKYRSARLNNFAAYFISGFKYSIDYASNEKVKNEDIPESIIKLKRHTSSVEVGMGTDFFLPYTKFSLELKMSYGLQDVLIQDNTELSTPIEKIVPKLFLLSLLIEG